MIGWRLHPGLAAAALWAAALPFDARAQAVRDAGRELEALRGELQLVEQEYGRLDESAASRARRKFSQGETQFLLRDWSHAAILLYDAVDEPEFRASADYPSALYYLGESLFQQGDLATARGYFSQVLAVPGAPHRREALVRALDVAVRLHSLRGLAALLAEAERTFGGRPPPEFLYLKAKATWRRRDLAPRDRMAQALAAFAAVPPPYHLAAAYFQGTIHLEAKNLAAAAQAFEGCGGSTPADKAQREIRELCLLALGRVYAEQGRPFEAIDRYQEIPRESRRFEEALHEMAWTYVRAGRHEQALRTASLLADLSPESRLAPEATILEGHLQLRLGRYADAVETYNRVINHYAPVRDEVDAILTMHEDPVRYFNEIIGRGDKAIDVTAMLPPVAVKWASTQADVARALEVVADVDRGRRDLGQGEVIADRLAALLARNDGLDAFPRLKEGWGRADAVENGVARLDGGLAAAAGALVLDQQAVPPDVRAEVVRAREERQRLEAAASRLPGSALEARARLVRIQAGFAHLDRAAFRLGYEVEAAKAAIAGTQTWLDQHRGETTGSAAGRAEFQDEIRKHRDVVAGYEEELRALRRDIGLAADGVAGADGSEGDGSVRQAYRRAVQREWEALTRAAPALAGRDRERFEELRAPRSAFGELLDRAARLKGLLRGTARGSGEGLKARVQAERRRMAEHAGELDRIQEETKDHVGRIAYRSFRAVRDQFYRLVLKADIGIVDVAWQRKRERLDKIQQLSTQKSADLAAMDQEFRGVLLEVQ